MWIDVRTLYLHMLKQAGIGAVSILAMLAFVALCIYIGMVCERIIG